MGTVNILVANNAPVAVADSATMLRVAEAAGIPAIRIGTTGGQVYVSPDGGDHWRAIVRDLPSVLSVEVQTLP